MVGAMVALISLIARLIRPRTFVRLLRKSLLAGLLLIPASALISILPLIFGTQEYMRIQNEFTIDSPKYEDVACLATLSTELVRDSSCYGGIISKDAVQYLPAYFSNGKSDKDHDFLIWLVDMGASGATVTSEGMILDVIPAKSQIWCGWILLRHKPRSIGTRLVSN